MTTGVFYVDRGHDSLNIKVLHLSFFVSDAMDFIHSLIEPSVICQL